MLGIIFHRLGPYHLARLKAIGRKLEVLAIEESTHTSEYQWDEVNDSERTFKRVTLLSVTDPVSASPASEIARRIEIVLSQHRPTVIAIPGWSDPAALAALSWGLENGVPIIVMSESTALDEPRRAWKEYIKSRIVRLCQAGLAGGTPHKEYLEKLGLPAKRIFTGYDAVDNEHFAVGARSAQRCQQTERAKLGLPERYFLASSRFVEQKNLPMLLESFALYCRTNPKTHWELVLLGDGPLRAELLDLRNALGLNETVLLPGFKQYDDLPAYYGLAGAFVHASTREPWGLVVNEAMAAGLPVIVSNRCGCARDLVVQGENGYVFDPTNPAELAEKMAAIAGSPPALWSQMSTASRRLIENWSPAYFAESLLSAVESALDQPLRRASWIDRFLLRGLIRQANDQARRLLPVMP